MLSWFAEANDNSLLAISTAAGEHEVLGPTWGWETEAIFSMYSQRLLHPEMEFTVGSAAQLRTVKRQKSFFVLTVLISEKDTSTLSARVCG